MFLTQFLLSALKVSAYFLLTVFALAFFDGLSFSFFVFGASFSHLSVVIHRFFKGSAFYLFTAEPSFVLCDETCFKVLPPSLDLFYYHYLVTSIGCSPHLRIGRLRSLSFLRPCFRRRFRLLGHLVLVLHHQNYWILLLST